MRYYKQIGASAALLTGLASGLAISTLDPSAAHAAEIEADTSAWGTPTTTQSKTVTYVDSTGKVLGTGKLTVNAWEDVDDRYQYVLDRTIPAGYKLANKSDLYKTPDTLTVVADPSSKAPSSDQWITILEPNASPAGDGICLNTLFRKSKTVTYVDSAGKIVGTGKLTVYCDDVQEGSRKYYSLSYWLDNSIPAGYKLLDNSSLGNFPDTLTVVADSSSSVPSSAHFGKTFGQLSTSDPSNPSTSIMTRIVKHVSYVTDGKVNGTDVKYSVGTGTIYAVDKIVDGKKVTVYELDDSVPKGYYIQKGQSIQNLPSQIQVAASGKAQDGSNGIRTQSKTVTYVDESGKVVGTGKITISSASDGDGGSWESCYVDKTIPAGYKLRSNDDLDRYPDKLTVVPDPNSTELSSDSTASAIASAPVSPREKQEERTVYFVDESGKSVGTGKITCNTYSIDGANSYSKTTYSINDTIPSGYVVKNPEELMQFPNKLTVVPSGNGQSNQSSNSSSSKNGGDGKSGVADAGHGTNGSGTEQSHESSSITNGNASSKVESNGKGSANTSGTSNPITSNSTKRSSNAASKPELAAIKAKPVLYVDETGKKLGTGQISVKSDGTRTIYAVNKTIPAGYALKNTSDLKNYPDKLTLVKSAASTDTSDASAVSYARAADGKAADGKATGGTGADGGENVESGDADAGRDAKDGGTVSITSTDAGKSKTAAPATTTTTTSTGSTESNSSSSLPQTGNTAEETSSAVGAALLMATMTVAGIARKKL